MIAVLNMAESPGADGLGRTPWNLAECDHNGLVGSAALVTNVGVAMLYTFREGGANMRSVWLCSRNDAIGNLAVILAPPSVFGTAQAWPDFAAATLMSMLSLNAARFVIRQSMNELRSRRLAIA
jgi:Co/Zn/Cd efflux system component